MIGRRRRIARLEAVLQDVVCPWCTTVTYAYSPEQTVAGDCLDDVIDAAVAEQGSSARRYVALPHKASREDWMAMAQANIEE
jgi:hypothetical protein